MTIYTLNDPNTGEVRYVGYSSNVSVRFQHHLQDARSGKNTHKARWISSLLKYGLQPSIEILEENVAQPGIRERFWINKLRESGCDLTNGTDGGDGCPGLKWSPESKAALSKRMKGHALTERQTNALKAANDARTMSPEARQKIGATRKGKRHSQQSRDRIASSLRKRT